MKLAGELPLVNGELCCVKLAGEVSLVNGELCCAKLDGDFPLVIGELCCAKVAGEVPLVNGELCVVELYADAMGDGAPCEESLDIKDQLIGLACTTQLIECLE